MLYVKSICRIAVIAALTMFWLVSGARAQSSGNIEGTVLDPDGKAVAKATVTIENPVSHSERSAETDANGSFRFTNVPFNPYHLKVTASGFALFAQDVDVRSLVAVTVKVSLKLPTASVTTVVEGGASDLLEQDPTAHTDIDRGLFNKLPLESQSSSVSSLVTLSSPGIVADSNGLFHGLGDHAQNSFSVDGQPITDQQSKIFSNQIPVDSLQSLTVISGAPPAEYGGKTSVVIVATTRSGLGQWPPTGSITTSYGSFGSVSGGFNTAFGGKNWGNFLSESGLNTSRFLDPPEIRPIHDKGNEQNFFDRMDFKLSKNNSLQLNLGYTRSWFQNPNSIDAQTADAWSGLVVDNGGFGPNGLLVGPQDQRSQIQTINLAPTFTHLFGANGLLTVGVFYRQDGYHYYGSRNPFSDLTPGLQLQSINQGRRLANAGGHADFSYVKGAHNIKAGVTYGQTFLRENDSLGIVDPTFNPPCFMSDGITPVTDPTVTSCTGTNVPNPNFVPALSCLDLTRPGLAASQGCANSLAIPHIFRGRTDVKELALYVQDTISKGNWTFNLGIRGDLYNGLSIARQAEPRVGIAYNIKKTSTVLRVSYARSLESPFNENLVLSSTGCNDPVINPLMTITNGNPCVNESIAPGYRNEFHAGLQQAFGKYLVVEGDYIWKYTHNAYDFSILGNTPIFFPITWHNSKIPGYAVRASMPNFHGLSAYVVFSHVSARFFDPQVAGIGAVPGGAGGVFRIDHDEKFESTAHFQYQMGRRGPWFGFNWRYDSGLVAGAVPFATDSVTPVDLTGLTADQQIQAGLFCGGVHPTLSSPLTTCAPSLYGSTLVSIPAPGTENDDHNPPRIAPRHLFDAAIGHDNLFHGDRYKWSVRFTVINLTNRTVLYNFLSTFSGTHYVTPRTFTGELGFHF